MKHIFEYLFSKKSDLDNIGIPLYSRYSHKDMVDELLNAYFTEKKFAQKCYNDICKILNNKSVLNQMAYELAKFVYNCPNRQVVMQNAGALKDFNKCWEFACERIAVWWDMTVYGGDASLTKYYKDSWFDFTSKDPKKIIAPVCSWINTGLLEIWEK